MLGDVLNPLEYAGVTFVLATLAVALPVIEAVLIMISSIQPLVYPVMPMVAVVPEVTKA